MRIKKLDLEEDRKKGWPIIGSEDGGGGDGDGVSNMKSREVIGESVVLEEKGEEFGLNSKEDEVVPRVEDVSLVDGVLEGAFGGEGDDDFAMGEVSLKGWMKKLECKPWIVVELKMKKTMEKNDMQRRMQDYMALKMTHNKACDRDMPGDDPGCLQDRKHSRMISTQEEIEHLYKKHEIWTQKRSNMDFKTFYGVTTSQRLRRNIVKARMVITKLVIDPCILALLKVSFDPVSPFIRQTAEIRITKDTLTSRLLSNWDPWNYKTDLEYIGDDVDINTLTMEQYMALIQDNIRRVVKPEIDGDVKFEINGNFMWELRRKLFKDILPVECSTLKDSIPLMTPTLALKSIQVMADHSHNWYDEENTRERINDSHDGVDTQKLKENIHAIQASFKNYKGAHLTKECPLKKVLGIKCLSHSHCQ
nr:hypothetical protein [Tanacetum cinerariifolium]